MADPVLPARVRKRDGSEEPFDADKICHALFAAAERLGQADAFLARELADGVVHFLAQSDEEETIATERIAQVVQSVVRELGHPALAQELAMPRSRPDRVVPEAAASLAAVLAEAARSYTLETVFSRDLAAAQQSGLICLGGLAAPGELAGCVLGPPLPVQENLLADLELARRFAGRYVAIDGLEQAKLPAQDLAQTIARGARLTGLLAVVNLNTAPPAWSGAVSGGPLFASAQEPQLLPRRQRALELFEALAPLTGEHIRIDWHVHGEDLALPESLIAYLGNSGDGLTLVFDRPRRPIALAEGLDRSHPAVLLEIGLGLDVLAAGPGMLSDVDRYCQRLGSLVRLGLSAAVQKRTHLRRLARDRKSGDPDLSSGFLLDRARCLIVPVGLQAVVELFTGWGPAKGGDSLDLARRILTRLDEVARQDGRRAGLDVCLDGPVSFHLDGAPDRLAGLTPWDERASVRSQLRSGAALCAEVGQGTLALWVEPGTSAGELAELLGQVWRTPEVTRVRLVRLHG